MLFNFCPDFLQYLVQIIHRESQPRQNYFMKMQKNDFICAIVGILHDINIVLMMSMEKVARFSNRKDQAFKMYKSIILILLV